MAFASVDYGVSQFASASSATASATNSGTMSLNALASAIASGAADAQATATNAIYQEVDGTAAVANVTNSGDLSLEGNAFASGSAAVATGFAYNAIEQAGNGSTSYTATVDNSGTIAITGIAVATASGAADASAAAWGGFYQHVSAGGLATLVADNSGSIDILANASAVGSAAIADAYAAAFDGDPVSAFGGIVALNRTVDLAAAELMRKIKLDIIIAPGYDDDALALLKRKKGTRLLTLDRSNVAASHAAELDVRPIGGGMLVQVADRRIDDPAGWRVVTEVAPTGAQMADLVFAWQAVRLVKSIRLGPKVVLESASGSMRVTSAPESRRVASSLSSRCRPASASGNLPCNLPVPCFAPRRTMLHWRRVGSANLAGCLPPGIIPTSTSSVCPRIRPSCRSSCLLAAAIIAIRRGCVIASR